MGADFVGYITPLAIPRMDAVARLKAMPFDVLLERCSEEWNPLSMLIEEGSYDLEVPGDTDTPVIDEEQLRARCLDAVMTAYDCGENRLRYGSGFLIGETRFAVAGGHSWGDTPDHVDDLIIADSLGVTFDESKTLKWVDA